MPGFTQARVDHARQFAVFFAVGGVEVVELHQEVCEVAAVLGLDVGDQLFRRDAFLFGTQHDGRAVGVVGADVDALVAAHFLEADPHVCLDVLEHMAKMDGSIGIGQGAGDENLTWLGHGGSATYLATG